MRKKKIIGYKATDKNMCCRDFRYELGKTYKEDTAILCERGFHFCENPMDVLNYYNITDGRFFEVECSDVSDETNKEDTKRVCKTIKLKSELSLGNFIKLSFDYMKTQVDTTAASGDASQVATSGDASQVATSGVSSKVAASGNYSKVATSGNYSQVATSGDSSKVATSGVSSKVATSGYYSQVATSGNYSKVATSGNYSQVATSGVSSKVATSGNYSQVVLDGQYGIGACLGIDSMAKGKKGNWIVLVEYNIVNNTYIPVCVKSAQIDGIILKEDTWYILKNGEFVNVVD